MKNFPFQALRESQSYVLNEIATAFASGYKYIRNTQQQKVQTSDIFMEGKFVKWVILAMFNID